jgi:hypothetical protein
MRSPTSAANLASAKARSYSARSVADIGSSFVSFSRIQLDRVTLSLLQPFGPRHAASHRLSGPGYLGPFVLTILLERRQQHDPFPFGKDERDAPGLVGQIERELEKAVTELSGSWHADSRTMLTHVLDP